MVSFLTFVACFCLTTSLLFFAFRSFDAAEKGKFL